MAFSWAFKCGYDELINKVGRDPDEIVNTEYPPEQPESRRSIGINELVYAGYLMGKMCVPIMPYTDAGHYDSGYHLSETCLFQPLLYNEGVLCCSPKEGSSKPRGHAVYWDCRANLVRDPNGTTYAMTKLLEDFTIDVFWIVK